MSNFKSDADRLDMMLLFVRLLSSVFIYRLLVWKAANLFKKKQFQIKKDSIGYVDFRFVKKIV